MGEGEGRVAAAACRNSVRVRFDTYRLADHKETMIDILARVVTVSLETVRIVAEMRAARGVMRDRRRRRGGKAIRRGGKAIRRGGKAIWST